MNDEPTKLREAFELFRREEQQQSRDHLDFEQLLSFHRDELSTADQETADRHLTWCTACVERSIGLARALGPATELEEDDANPFEEEDKDAAETSAPPVDPAYLDSLWQKVQPLLTPAAAGTVLPFSVSRLGEQEVRPRTRSRLSSSVRRGLKAAALVVLTVGTVAAFLLLRPPAVTLAELNVPIESLEAEDFVRLSGPERSSDLPIVAPGAVLILTPGREPRAESYSVEIFAEPSATPSTLVWQGNGLAPAPEGNFRLRLPSDLRAATEYRIRVAAVDGSYATDFRFRLEHDEG